MQYNVTYLKHKISTIINWLKRDIEHICHISYANALFAILNYINFLINFLLAEWTLEKTWERNWEYTMICLQFQFKEIQKSIETCGSLKKIQLQMLFKKLGSRSEVWFGAGSNRDQPDGVIRVWYEDFWISSASKFRHNLWLTFSWFLTLVYIDI